MGSGIKVKIRPAENRASLPSSFGLGIGVDSGTGVEYGMRKIFRSARRWIVRDGLEFYSHVCSMHWSLSRARGTDLFFFWWCNFFKFCVGTRLRAQRAWAIVSRSAKLCSCIWVAYTMQWVTFREASYCINLMSLSPWPTASPLWVGSCWAFCAVHTDTLSKTRNNCTHYV